ncbi:hypothetical protein [Mucilaginibacter psychrotolerans]|uniref:Uncharacterized protein n=1 Tax=Mucilaginibacter psychrotolerans TaxID=1524096 RepID=A0A4Y8RWY1_9SPHI|nr:hypothetical protein [Mucilaginibacter psychrotolerans]TFF29724.1 hypothetical protein E2R66_28035 [Mucilaginibacter psychrotolerans]
MRKKLTIKFSAAELQELVSIIPEENADKKKLKDLVATVILNSIRPVKQSSTELSAAGGAAPDPVMQLIVHILSQRTGFPESDFTPDTVLSSKGMTDSKITQLIGFLNQYIQSVNGSTIGAGEISTGDTVQSVYDLVQTKTP